MTSEDLWRATLHDFNNLLAGLQGVLDLSDPRAPLEPRNRLRLEASLEEGKTLIAMARGLALGRHPDPGFAPWPEWQAGLERKLAPLSQLFRCPIEVQEPSGAEAIHWPAPGLQDWIVAFTRQILPWVAPEPLRLEAQATATHWIILWRVEAPMPAALQPDPPPDFPRNLSAYWLKARLEQLGMEVSATGDGLSARMKRP